MTLNSEPTNPEIYQLEIQAEKNLNAQISDFLENISPEPLSVSHYENEDLAWVTTAHYHEAPDIDLIKTLIIETLELTQEDITVSLSKVENIDWVSHVQQGLKPVRAGRFFIHGSHDNALAKDEKFAIEIDAAQAFGTAHHGTTEGCLRAIDNLSDYNMFTNILDLGSGTGILAIAASMVWPNADIIASDIDPIAVEIAKSNDALNRYNHTAPSPIAHVCADGLEDKSLRSRTPYDLIIANILAGPLIEMSTDITNAIAPGGTLLLSGILDTQSNDVVTAYKNAGMKHIKTNHIAEWTTSLFNKPL